MAPLDFILDVLANATWSSIAAGGRRVLGRAIRITSPRPQELLTDPEPLGDRGLVSFPVQGTSKRLPADHAIWLLIRDDGTRLVWPQGFLPVRYNKDTGQWIGRVSNRGSNLITIIAVVAPPTSADFFNYYQAQGEKTGWVPLRQLPPECRNFTEVQARVPV